jgi:hypothetical protein
MQHFIALNINAPIAGALFECKVGMPAEDRVTQFFFFIPLRFDDLDFGISNRFNCFQRPVS